MVTISRPKEEMRKILGAFKNGGGSGKPIYLHAKISYARRDSSTRGLV